MSELEERLNAVLSNPGEMSRIAAMAQKLMGNLPPEGAAPPDAIAWNDAIIPTTVPKSPIIGARFPISARYPS